MGLRVILLPARAAGHPVTDGYAAGTEESEDAAPGAVALVRRGERRGRAENPDDLPQWLRLDCWAQDFGGAWH